ncbi:Lamin B1 [Oopsacas minuta]|uniref:Lamin B1 n=1 Tax=Oopsacas minuta TaxID=111878 RepID=A0AAV7K247_9METZ|nr:Lamin B1 [Oopsacas minuta]
MSKMDSQVLGPQMEQDKISIQCENHRFAQYLEITRRIRDSNMTLEKEIGIYQTTTGMQIKEIQDQYTHEIELADREQKVNIQEREQLHSQIKEQEKELEMLLQMEVALLEEGEVSKERLKRNNVTLVVGEKERDDTQERVQDLDQFIRQLQIELDTITKSLETEERETQNAYDELSEFLNNSVDSPEYYARLLEEKRREKDGLKSAYELRRMQTIDEVEERIADILEEIRKETEERAESYRKQIEEEYQIQFHKIRSSIESREECVSTLEEEVRLAWEGLTETNKRFKSLILDHMELEKRVSSDENSFEDRRRSFLNETRVHSEEIRNIKDNLGGNLEKIQELLGLKILISHEVDTYHTLLEEEEIRLNLNMDKPRRVFTRKRTSEEVKQQTKVHKIDPIFKSPSNEPERIEMTSQTTDTIVDNPDGFLHISNVDSDGRYILIKNNSDVTENLGSYKIKHSSIEESQIFKFKSYSKLQPGRTVRIWSNCLNARNSPPTDIIWRSQYKWITGRVTKTLLLNPKGEKVAVFTQRTRYVPQQPTAQTLQSQEQTDIVPDPVVVQDPPEQLREACSIM